MTMSHDEVWTMTQAFDHPKRGHACHSFAENRCETSAQYVSVLALLQLFFM